MNATDIAYLAGLIDGEGCIGARRHKQGFIHMHIEVCMTDAKPLKWAHQTTGIGSLYFRRSKPGRRDVWKWSISSAQTAAPLLRRLLPHLKVKREEAHCFLMLASLRLLKVGGRRRYPEVEDKICRLLAEFKARKITPEAAHQEALDLCVYLRQAIFEKHGK